ncbi:sodium/proton antiporter NhaB [Cocleimonas flava]|uniref:Na(+)/H(+) antiporter NhaB n=1 Tax=Cocleimonas flava TaxID=634765 RepID=A0A4R1EST5_9GAMM|nr:sodium/proton antiporter NhaB [Cocleimonas flava]TCJ82834.1 sodium/proton antiporter (NhaB family) [Cocleimonas flava]
MLKTMFSSFLGTSPNWFKITLLAFLIISFPLTLLLGKMVAGWAFIAMFILSLAMALKCYPLQSGGLIAITSILLGLTTTETLWHEIQQNLGVIMLLMFMVSFIYFMQPLLIFIFGKILLKVENKIILSLMFSISAALLSAFLDALTVTAVLISVFVALYGVYEKVHSTANTDFNENEVFDNKEMGGESFDNFRAFIRSLVMHGAIGTAIGGVATLVREPQNLLIGEIMGWDFLTFAAEVSHVSIPAFIAGLLIVIGTELTGTFGYGGKLEPNIRKILKTYIEQQNTERTQKEVYALVIQGICAILLICGLAFHVMEVGLIGLMLMVLLTAMTGITEEKKIGHAFEESLPFVSLLVIFFVIVGMIHDQHLFTPIVNWVLTLPTEEQPRAFFLANGILSAISDNVFVATVYINEVKAAFDAGNLSREHFDALAVAINTGTNLPSVATPNGQAAFLFLLTSTLAPAIRLGYMRMVYMALPYTIVLTLVGLFAQ